MSHGEEEEKDEAYSQPNLNESTPLINRSPSQGPPQIRYTKQEILAITIGFCLSIAVAGLTNMAYSDNIVSLAENVGTNSVELGGVYIWRGAGAIGGSFLFPYLSTNFKIMRTLYGSFIIFILITTTTAFCTSERLLYFLYLLSGLFGSILNTGSMTMVRTIHGADAGPWLTTCLLIYSLSGSFSVVLQMISLKVIFNFLAISAIATVSLVWLCFQPSAEVFLTQLQVKKRKKEHSVEHYHVEMLCAVGMFGLIGGSSVLTAYSETYVNNTHVLSPGYGPMMLLTYRICSNFAKMLLAVMQTYFGTAIPSLMVQFASLALISISGFCSTLIFPRNGVLLWVVFAVFGLANGPGSSMVFDIGNKLSTSTDFSTSILMVGLNLGSAFPPWIASVLWRFSSLGNSAFIVTIVMLTSISLSVLFTPYLTYLKDGEAKRAPSVDIL